MTIERLNETLTGKTIVRIEKRGKVYKTDVFEYGDAKPDPANGEWCYVKRAGEEMLHLYPMRKSLLEEITERGTAVLTRTNEAEIEARRKAGLFPLPDYEIRTTHYVLT